MNGRKKRSRNFVYDHHFFISAKLQNTHSYFRVIEILYSIGYNDIAYHEYFFHDSPNLQSLRRPFFLNIICYYYN